VAVVAQFGLVPVDRGLEELQGQFLFLLFGVGERCRLGRSPVVADPAATAGFIAETAPLRTLGGLCETRIFVRWLELHDCNSWIVDTPRQIIANDPSFR
jgi:hypothetical protein